MNENENEEVRSKNKECVKCEEYLGGWKRALADYDNLKKDLMHERTEIRRMAAENLAHQLIPVLDHFDQALKFKPEGLKTSVNNWLQGILIVRSQLESVLHDLGMEAFGEIGEVFDANLHDAGAERVQEGTEPGMIVEVIQRGWKREEKIVRPAKVIISK